MAFFPLCRRLEIGGSEMDCVIFGRGDIPFVILPGLSTKDVKSAGVMLSIMYRDFARDYTVYVFDKKRHIPEGCTIDELAEDVAEAMTALGIKSAHVLGVSQGGMIGQYLALAHPELVVSLVLAFTLSRPNHTVNDAIRRWVHFAESDNFPAFAHDMFERMYSPAYLKKYRLMLPLVSRFFKPKDVPRFIRLAKSCLSCDCYDRLGEIRCGVFVVGAELDKVVSPEASEEIAKKLSCRLHMFKGLGHAAYDEARDFNKLVLQFLKSS